MSEQKSNNDSATGTFSFFETFQSSGDGIPSLDSFAVSGELPQLPASDPETVDQSVAVEPAAVEAVVEQEPEIEVVASVEETAAEVVVAEAAQPEPVVSAASEADDDEYDIDPVLRPPVANAEVVKSAPGTEEVAEVVHQSVTQKPDATAVQKSTPAVEAAPVIETQVVEAPVVEPVVAVVEPIAQSPVKVVEQAAELVIDAPSAPTPKPLTVQEIVAAAAARARSGASATVVPEVVVPEVVAPQMVTPVAVNPVVVEPVVVQPTIETPAAKPAAFVSKPVVAAPEVSVPQPVASKPPVVHSPVASSPVEAAVPNHEVKSENQPEAKPAESDGKLKFAELALSDAVKAAVQQSGYDTPTEIQAQIIPHMLEGRDVLAQSQTGTGKTAAFALPILSRIKTEKRETQVLVLAPTRELAMQVAESFETYGSQVRGFQVAAIYGGAGYENQIRQLKRASVVVGTPGRVIDHIKKGTLKLDSLDCLVLDEADEMLNMGFLEDVQFVLEKTPANRQVALFSATMPVPIRNIADRYLDNPAKITVKQKTMTAEAIRQRAAFVSPRDKMEVLARFLEVEETEGVLVFARTREATSTIADELNARGLKAAALNGDMPQQVRERTVEQLKAGRLNIVVATDVAARGLDVPRILHVFNYDVPMDNESYIHRIGRTGRAGKKGHAILFVTGGQKNRLRSIERATRQPIEIVEAPTAEQVNEVRKKTFLATIDQTIGKRDLSFFKQMLQDHAAATEVELIDIAAALADQLQQGRSFFATDLPKTRRRENEGGRDRNERGGRDRFEREDRGGQQDRRRNSGPPRGGMQRYRIEVGRADNVKPGNIVGAVANEGGIDGDQIGPISIYDDYSTVDLPDGMPADVFQTLRKVRVAGKQLQLSRATPSDDQEQKRFAGKKFGDRNSSGGASGGRRFGSNRGGQSTSGGGGFKGKSFAKKKFRRD